MYNYGSPCTILARANQSKGLPASIIYEVVISKSTVLVSILTYTVDLSVTGYITNILYSA